jgi:hypothetical protein
MSGDEGQFLQSLHTEIESEIVLSHSDDAIDVVGSPTFDPLLDPTAIEREQVGLSNLLGAVEAWEHRDDK